MSIQLISPTEIDRLLLVAGALIPGDEGSPGATEVEDLRDLLAQAVTALGPEIDLLRAALAELPIVVDFAALERFAAAEPAAFDLISTTAAAAYFMSERVLRSIGYPVGARRAAPLDRAVEELDGLLDVMLEREPLVRLPPPNVLEGTVE